MNRSRLIHQAFFFLLLFAISPADTRANGEWGVEIVKEGNLLGLVGAPIDYQLTVRNIGTTYLFECQIEDSKWGSLPPAFPLAPGEVQQFTYTILVAPVDPDPLQNTATVRCCAELNGSPDAAAPSASPQTIPVCEEVIASDSHTVELFQPDITVTKEGPTLAYVGFPAIYPFTITNTSSPDSPNLLLHTITDNVLGDLRPVAEAAGCTILEPGTSCYFEVERIVAPGDPDPLENTVEVTYHPEGFERLVSASASHTVELFQPAVEVIKEGDIVGFPGFEVTYDYTIINPSSADSPPLVLESMLDDVLGDLFAPAAAAGCDDLPPGASCTFQVSYTLPVPQSDPLVNVVTVHYHPAGFPNDITDADDHSIQVLQPADLQGNKYEDLNANGILDAGEPPLAGVEVTLEGVDYFGNAVLLTDVTDAGGVFQFAGLVPGEYTVTETAWPPGGWTPSTPISSGPHSLGSGDSLDLSWVFGNFRNAIKSGFKFEDLNADGFWDANEPGVAGVEICAYGYNDDNGDRVLGAPPSSETCVTTAANGNYQLELTPGAYLVCEKLPGDEWVQSFPVNGDCAGLPGAALSGYTIFLSSGQEDTDNNFGNFRHVRVRACKAEDRDANPRTTDDLERVAGWIMYLHGPDGRADDADGTLTGDVNGSSLWGETGPDGCVTWDKLLPGGPYWIEEDLPADWYAWTPTQFFCERLNSGELCSFTFVNSEKVDVQACKAEDADGDLDTTTDRSRVTGWPVKLLRNGEVIDRQSTGRDGCYVWENLDPAPVRPTDPTLDPVVPVEAYRYAVSEKDIVREGWYAVSDEEFRCGPIGSGETCSKLLVNSRYASIAGHKWSDLNRNGRWDTHPDPGPVEPGLTGWVIELRTEDGVIASATTVGDRGEYRFDDLQVGIRYFVCEVPLPGYDQTFPFPSDFLCERVRGEGYGHIVEPLSGEEIIDKDFGNSGCGNGRVDAVAGEQCDDNRSGCCDQACQFQPCGLVTDSALCEFDREPAKGVCSDDGEACLFDPDCIADGGIVCTQGGECLDVFGNDLGDCAVGDPCQGDCMQSKQFRLNFNPDAQNWVAYRLNASNPGQYYYTAIYDASGHLGDLVVDIVVPYPFVTQGAMPLHVYDADEVPSSAYGCPDPQRALTEFATVITMADWIQGLGYTAPGYLQCDPVSGECVIRITIPAAKIAESGGLLYLALHLDYGLKGNFVDADADGVPDRYDRHAYVSPWGSSDALFDTQGQDGDVAIADCTAYLFSHEVDGAEQDRDSAENLNIFKRPVGVYGSAMCDGSPLEGWIGLFDKNGTFVQAAEIDEEGYYGVDYSHKGKPSYYDLKWCGTDDCADEIGEGYKDQYPGGFGLQSKGFAEINMVDSSAACDGAAVGNPVWDEAVYFSGKFSKKKP
jgi:hypothetical protein